MRLAGRAAGAAGGIAAAVVLVDVASKQLAGAWLPGAPVELGIGRLQLSHNTGVAFSLGNGLPTWLVLGVASVITLGVAVAIVLEHLRPPMPAGLVLGGAVANVVDRAGDGAVTDLLWLGWFPTFNLADTAITLGALALLWAAWRRDVRREASADLDARAARDGATDAAEAEHTPQRPPTQSEHRPGPAARRTTE